jgi:hypothetical protein
MENSYQNFGAMFCFLLQVINYTGVTSSQNKDPNPHNVTILLNKWQQEKLFCVLLQRFHEDGGSHLQNDGNLLPSCAKSRILRQHSLYSLLGKPNLSQTLCVFKNGRRG